MNTIGWNPLKNILKKSYLLKEPYILYLIQIILKKG